MKKHRSKPAKPPAQMSLRERILATGGDRPPFLPVFDADFEKHSRIAAQICVFPISQSRPITLPSILLPPI